MGTGMRQGWGRARMLFLSKWDCDAECGDWDIVKWELERYYAADDDGDGKD